MPNVVSSVVRVRSTTSSISSSCSRFCSANTSDTIVRTSAALTVISVSPFRKAFPHVDLAFAGGVEIAVGLDQRAGGARQRQPRVAAVARRIRHGNRLGELLAVARDLHANVGGGAWRRVRAAG